MLQLVLGVIFILHGLVHLLWFAVPWQITTVDGLPIAKYGLAIDLVILLLLFLNRSFAWLP